MLFRSHFGEARFALGKLARAVEAFKHETANMILTDDARDKLDEIPAGVSSRAPRRKAHYSDQQCALALAY